jgi:hypothetical protein
MGKPGAKHTGTESSESLRKKAKSLEAVASDLREVAERMDRRGVRTIIVLHSEGLKSVVVKLKAFAVDADKKATKAGA